jgi:hypothetical protein
VPSVYFGVKSEKQMTTRKDVDSAVVGLVGLIRSTEDPQEAYWSVQQYGGAVDESYIKANRAGVLLFAADLLEAGIGTVEPRGKANHVLNTVDQSGEVGLDYIELVEKNGNSPTANKEPRTVWGMIALVLWVAVILFVLACLIVGFMTIVMRLW